MKPTQDLVLWGATGQAKVLHELLQDTPWRLAALVDNRAVLPPLPNIPLLLGTEGLDAWLHGRAPGKPLVGAVAVGGDRGADRLHLMATLTARGIVIVTLVHRTAFVAGDSEVGPGCQVLAHANVCSQARLGRGVIVNTAASVDHDCVLEDGVHVGPGARLAGEIRVGEYAFIGTGAIVLPRITIGAGAIVGAGAVVIRDVPRGCVVVGNPARQVRANHV
jgi:sugar O-acyltransferase (sialic acid O-acetyltransferase NeuD family)